MHDGRPKPMCCLACASYIDQDAHLSVHDGVWVGFHGVAFRDIIDPSNRDSIGNRVALCSVEKAACCHVLTAGQGQA